MVNLTQKEFEKQKSLKVIFPMFIKINDDELTKDGVDAISVLTEKIYFLGNNVYI
jgi:indole-3-glycerol phosphate synthase